MNYKFSIIRIVAFTCFEYLKIQQTKIIKINIALAKFKIDQNRDNGFGFKKKSMRDKN